MKAGSINRRMLNDLQLFLKYARFRYICYRLFLRIKIGKDARDEYLKKIRLSPIDFLPERSYVMKSGVKAIPRKGTTDFYMLFVAREQDIGSHLAMKEGETFVDIGANVGSYTLNAAKEYMDKGVKIIAVEAHPDNYKALCRNIQINSFRNVKTINKAVSDHKGKVTLYERSHDGIRVDSELYSVYETAVLAQNNLPHPGGNRLQTECDTLDNMLLDQRVDVMKIDIEGAEVMALKGAGNTLRQLRKIVVEIHGDNNSVVHRILLEHDFQVHMTDEKRVIGSRNL
jgi:FkbM family methyltransferase